MPKTLKDRIDIFTDLHVVPCYEHTGRMPPLWCPNCRHAREIFIEDLHSIMIQYARFAMELNGGLR